MRNAQTKGSCLHTHMYMYLTHGLNFCKHGRVCSLFWSPLCHFIGLTISIICRCTREVEIEEFRKRERREKGRKNQWEGREGGIKEGKSEGEKEGKKSVFTNSTFPDCQGMKKEEEQGGKKRMEGGRKEGRKGGREGEREGGRERGRERGREGGRERGNQGKGKGDRWEGESVGKKRRDGRGPYSHVHVLAKDN